MQVSKARQPNDQEPMYMQGSARVVTFGGQDGGAGSPTCCKGLLPARGQLPPAPAAGTVPFPGENMGRWRERWALRCILVTGQTGPSWQGQLKCEIWEEKLAFCAYYTFPPGLVVGFLQGDGVGRKEKKRIVVGKFQVSASRKKKR